MFTRTARLYTLGIFEQLDYIHSEHFSFQGTHINYKSMEPWFPILSIEIDKFNRISSRQL